MDIWLIMIWRQISISLHALPHPVEARDDRQRPRNDERPDLEDSRCIAPIEGGEEGCSERYCPQENEAFVAVEDICSALGQISRPPHSLRQRAPWQPLQGPSLRKSPFLQ